MKIRKGTLADLPEMQQLFADTIKSVCKGDYTDEQLDVWAAGIDNKERWENILKTQQVFIAHDASKITGFCTLDNGNYIDLFFVHKDHQRQGIAQRLYTEIEKAALSQTHSEITANVSKTAKPFFEKMGFKVVKEQNVDVKGIILTNYKMVKRMGEGGFRVLKINGSL